MEVEDRLTIATPEGVELELTLAGLGSRMVAGLADLALKGLLIAVLAIALLALGGAGVALFLPLAVAVLLFYDVLFEVLGHGRTPGKRWAGLRVLRASGRPVDLRASAVRNLLRVVDGLPLSYLPTVVSIVATRRNQRLGDLAADTIVVRERRAAATGIDASRLAAAPPPDPFAARWDVSAITRDELTAVTSFLARRDSFDRAARERVARQLAAALAPRVGGADEPDPERFLERLAAAKSARGAGSQPA